MNMTQLPLSQTVQPESRIISDAQITQINDGQMVASDTGPTIAGVTPDNLQQYLYELTQAVMKGQLAPEKLGVGVNCAGTVAKDCGSVLADVVWMSWAEASIDAPTTINSSTEWVPTAIAEDGPVLRLATLAKEMLQQQLVSKAQLQETGDSEFLAAAGFVVSAFVWHKKGVRVNTKMVYQQQKFNLLREESEGYAKLLTALNRVGNAAVSEQSAQGLVAEVKGLVGFFDLDPNRVASLALLALAQQPSKLAYLQLLSLFTQSCIEQTLGFLFQHHAGIDNRTPDSLFAAAVALLQAGTIRLEALMSHLSPDNSAMKQAASEAHAALMHQINSIGVISLSAPAEQSRPSGELNRLGPTLNSSSLQLDVKPMFASASSTLTSNNQRLGLLAALLRAGCWDLGTTVMGWLSAVGDDPVAHRPVAEAVASEVRTLLQPLLTAAYPGGATGRYALDTRGKRPGEAPTLEPLLMQRLELLGMHIAYDVALCSRLARVLRFVSDWHRPLVANSEQSDSPATETQLAAAAELAKVEEVLSSVLLPGMMLTPAVTAVCSEVWAILRIMPYTTRYRLYVQLREATASTPLLSAAAKLASVEVKKVLRRVHVPKDNRDRKDALKPFSRMLAKIAAANPLAVAQTMIAQVEAYPNMVDPYVEAMRFLTPLGLDILTFTIIDRLAASGRSKLKEDGVNISDWLTALCLFTGHAAKQFTGIDLVALAQYLANQLRAGEGFDLLLLKELVAVMTGLVTVTDVSADQVDAMAGGPTLCSQALAFGVVRNPKQLSRGMARLLAALQQGPPEQQLALPLLVLMGQQQQVIALQMEHAHLKLVAELYDKVEQTLLQFGNFLLAAMSPQEYRAMLPPLDTLVIDYGMDQEVAFQLYRPIFASISPPPPALPAAETNGTISKDDTGAEEGEIEEAPPAAATDEHGGDSEPAAGAKQQQQLAWPAVAASLRAIQPAPVWNAIGLELYFTFWSLSLYDIYVPVESYQRERLRLEAQLRAKSDAIRNAQRDLDLAARGFAVDPAILAALPDIPTVQKEIQRIEQVLEKLPTELKEQQRNHAAVARRLKAESATWLRGHANGKHMSEMFVLHCIVPRMKYSATDAVYCAKFMKIMHELHTYNYSSLTSYDKVIKDTVALVLCSTDAEANNLGIFLQHTLSLMSRWRADVGVYEAECRSNPCFSAFYTSSTVVHRTAFSMFRKLSNKWQMRLTKAFKTALESGEYVQIRNALIVLSKLLQVFPEVKGAAATIKASTAKVRNLDKREDLKTLANMYFNSLNAQLMQRPTYESQQYVEDPAVTAKKAAAAKADAEVRAVRKAAEAEAAEGRAKRQASAAAAAAAAAAAQQGLRPSGTSTNSDVKAGRHAAAGAERGTPPPATSDSKSPASNAKPALPAAAINRPSDRASRSVAAAAAATAPHGSPASSERQAARDKPRDSADVASRTTAASGAKEKRSGGPDSPSDGGSTRSDAKRARISAPSAQDAQPSVASKLRADAPAFTQQQQQQQQLQQQATASDVTRSATTATAPQQPQRASKRLRTSDSGSQGLSNEKAKVSAGSTANPGQVDKAPTISNAKQPSKAVPQAVHKPATAAGTSGRTRSASGAANVASSPGDRVPPRPAGSRPDGNQQARQVTNPVSQPRQPRTDEPTARPEPPISPATIAATAPAAPAAKSMAASGTSAPPSRPKHAPVVFTAKQSGKPSATPAALPKRKREDLGGIPAVPAVLNSAPTPPARVIQVVSRPAIYQHSDQASPAVATGASFWSRKHRTELQRQVQQLDLNWRPEVQRIVRNDPSQSFETMSPETIAALTNLVQSQQAKPRRIQEHAQPREQPASERHHQQTSQQPEQTSSQDPQHSDSEQRSVGQADEAHVVLRNKPKVAKSEKSRKSKSDRHEHKKDRSHRRNKGHAASGTEKVEDTDVRDAKSVEQVKAGRHKSKKHKRDRDR